ncbi:cystine transporter permease [Ammoniphilus oxalaticus]|uniref:Cystine transporter permease n=1 Tax=Ammoniphilus oxalaticus TaxID=66863 RepID=A0A419SH76_9BACL|nr:amino acid ABC transporter permease [Ammoniphilus oxalaticus]RKD23140.1 cystine transporter permease [Ammoniphilus oxalaticus]
MADIINLFMQTWPGFLKAAWFTLRLTAVALVFGSVVGLIVAFMRLSKWRIISGLSQIYITMVRGTPLILQIYVLYWGMREIILLDRFWAGVIALAIHNGAYIAEIFRGAIQSIDKGQAEAARSLGMSLPLTMRRIILPQAFKRAIPPLGNQFIIGLKDSSLVGFIGYQELYMFSNSTAARTLLNLESYMIAGLYYLALVLIFTYIVHRLEQRLDVDNNHKGGVTHVEGTHGRGAQA